VRDIGRIIRGVRIRRQYGLRDNIACLRAPFPGKLLCLFFCASFLALGQTGFAADKLSYDVKLSGLDASAFDNIKSLFKTASLLEADRHENFVSVSNLQKNLKSDIRLMNRILRSEGYYDNSITEGLKRQKNHFEVDMHIMPGPIYLFGEVKIDFLTPRPDDIIRRKISESLSFMNGKPARAADVMIAEAKITDRLPMLGFPFAGDLTRDLVVDHHTRTMTVTFRLEAGQRRRIGATHFKGLRSVEASYLTKFITWHSHDYFDQRLVRDLRSRLNKSGLFSTITIDITPMGNDRADIDITFTEAKHRTIGAAAGYSTAEGISGEISWENRNFWDRGNWLKFTARGAELEQSFSGRLEIPNFSRLDQTLSFDVAYRRQNTTAFFANSINGSTGINRIITPRMAVRSGLDLEYSDVTDAPGKRIFYIASLPIGIRWDSSDDLLDPHRGMRVSLVSAPAIGMDGISFTFLESEFRASAYYPLIPEKAIVALRSRLGSIVGAKTEVLPATRRFFAGGGGSVRGFAFQRVGPLDGNGTPLGGRSVTEVAAEIRWKMRTNISIVPFVEGGNVYESEFPKFSDLRWAVGMGARYHTDFGPIRFDVAFPVKRRVGDSLFQIYISLGQAF